jgi:hypothetical protein
MSDLWGIAKVAAEAQPAAEAKAKVEPEAEAEVAEKKATAEKAAAGQAAAETVAADKAAADAKVVILDIGQRVCMRILANVCACRQSTVCFRKMKSIVKKILVLLEVPAKDDNGQGYILHYQLV